MVATNVNEGYGLFLTLADGDVDSYPDPDPTGEFATGDTHFFASGEEFLAFLESVSAETA